MQNIKQISFKAIISLVKTDFLLEINKFHLMQNTDYK